MWDNLSFHLLAREISKLISHSDNVTSTWKDELRGVIWLQGEGLREGRVSVVEGRYDDVERDVLTNDY